jgi:hypothetical protein
MNESQYSVDNKGANENNMEYDADTYNSFNFESRVADYGKKTSTILKTDEFGSANSNATGRGRYIQPKNYVGYPGYVPPVNKNIIYTKDEYPSGTNESYDTNNKNNGFRNGIKGGYPSYNYNGGNFGTNGSFSDYDGDSQNGLSGQNLQSGKNNLNDTGIEFGKKSSGKIAFNKQETIDYNSVYDDHSNYFSGGGMDPK